jgi:hypothetical protein
VKDKCKICGGPLYIGPSGHESDVGTTEVKLIQSFYCPSATCKMFKKLIRVEKEAPKPPVFEE